MLRENADGTGTKRQVRHLAWIALKIEELLAAFACRVAYIFTGTIRPTMAGEWMAAIRVRGPQGEATASARITVRE
ncbi:MAG: hypothetical protein ACREIA_13825 [Opitutaceae bacterium]